MKALVSEQCRLLIQVLLTDPKIAERVFENAADKDKYKICDIREDGSIVMGKTSCRFWNQLIKCQDKLTFESFALKVWDALVDSSSGLNNVAIMKGLSQEIIMCSVRRKDYDLVVHRLYECWTHVAQKSSGYQGGASPEGGSVVGNQGTTVVNLPDQKRQIIIRVNGEDKIIPFVDSIGEPLNLGLKIGITGVTKIV